MAGNQFDVIGDASLEAGSLSRNLVDPWIQSQFVCAGGIRRTSHLGSGGVVGHRYFRAWDDCAEIIGYLSAQGSRLLSVRDSGNPNQEQHYYDNKTSLEHGQLLKKR